MQANDQVDVIIYRLRDTGLEVFLVSQGELDEANEQWKTPGTVESTPSQFTNCIHLDPVTDANGDARKAIAIEADWHEIPSLRALIYEDYRVAKEKAKQRIKSLMPEMEKGAFFAVKEAIKRVMPVQYAFIKELKEVLLDKESTKYI